MSARVARLAVADGFASPWLARLMLQTVEVAASMHDLNLAGGANELIAGLDPQAPTWFSDGTLDKADEAIRSAGPIVLALAPSTFESPLYRIELSAAPGRYSRAAT